MIIDEDGWCSPDPGQSDDDFLTEFVNFRPPLSDAEIVMLRAAFRPLNETAVGLPSEAA